MTAVPQRLARLVYRPHLRWRTVRIRLTALYGALFLLSRAALLAITYLLVVNATSGFIFSTPIDHGHGHGHATIVSSDTSHHPSVVGEEQPATRHPALAERVLSVSQLQAEANRQHARELQQLLLNSGIALAGMALVSIWLGWIVAGRVLGPLRTVTATTREISARSLHRRLALNGPEDELKDLADTIGALLARLEGSFQAQRAFVASASHELRTPLALSRAMLSFALTDPELTSHSKPPARTSSTPAPSTSS